MSQPIPILVTVVVEHKGEKTIEYKAWRTGDVVGLNDQKATIRYGIVDDDEKGEYRETENTTDEDGNSPFTRATNEIYKAFPEIDGAGDLMEFFDAVIRLAGT